MLKLFNFFSSLLISSFSTRVNEIYQNAEHNLFEFYIKFFIFFFPALPDIERLSCSSQNTRHMNLLIDVHYHHQAYISIRH
jgi:hypothetical protein